MAKNRIKGIDKFGDYLMLFKKKSPNFEGKGGKFGGFFHQ